MKTLQWLVVASTNCQALQDLYCSWLSQVNGNGILGSSQGNAENNIHHTKALMNHSGAEDAPSLGFTNQMSDFPKHIDKSGKRG